MDEEEIISKYRCKETTSFSTSYRSYRFEKDRIYNIKTIKNNYGEIFLIEDESENGEYLDPLSSRFINHTFTFQLDEIRNDAIDNLLL